MFAGHLASGGGVLEAAEAARAAPPAPQPPRAVDLLLDGLAVLITDGYAAGAPMFKQALSAFRSEELSTEEGLRWLWVACQAAMDLWDDESWDVLSNRFAQLARDAGALGVLPLALSALAGIFEYAGELSAAASLVEEVDSVNAAIGSHLGPYAALGLVALQGREDKVSELINASMKEVVSRGEGLGLGPIHWARAFVGNGAGRYEEALAAAEQARDQPAAVLHARWALIELIEAAARSGKADVAADALDQLSETTRPTGTDWALGIEARSRALLSEGQAAEGLYREAIDRLGRTRVRMELARAHLIYGEWLRRENRRADAREQLHTAHEMLTAMGMEGFAARAARELVATGETARKRTVETVDELTAQEAQISALARDGLSNPEIGASLFISPRTVEYHLHKVYAKLGISSRNQLGRVLAADNPGGP
jgi:ATP/maltotriose-dependent transcriptional regulator MalT